MTKVEDISKTATVTAFAIAGVGATFMITMIFSYIANIQHVQREMSTIVEAAVQLEQKVVVADSVIKVQEDSIVKERIEKFVTVDSLRNVIDRYELTIKQLRTQNKSLKKKLDEK